MALALYEHPLSPYARKVKIVIYAKGLPLERRFVNPLASMDDPGTRAFVAASPRLEVPCLVDGGPDGEVRLFDSTIMLEYLEERYPEPPMQPASPAERARVRMLEEICDTELEAVNWGVMELRVFKRAEGARADEMLATAGRQLERLWGRLERELAGRAWMNGECFGRGDAAVWPHVAGSAFFGFPLPAGRFPKLADWSARCAAEPAVAKDSADLAAWVKENMKPGADLSGMPVVRQYRDHRLEWMMKSGGREIVLRGLDAGTIKFAAEHA
jgi:glutathione S-transferase/RNA polymerase-associated protein